jgi:hypothetical protein
MSSLDLLGWSATAAFATSYFCREARTLRIVQGLAALLWIAYGLVLHAAPVVIANLIVAAAAAYTSRRP